MGGGGGGVIFGLVLFFDVVKLMSWFKKIKSFERLRTVHTA